MKIHYVMPMAGRGSRFQGYDCPKPLISIYGKPFFYWSTQSIKKYVELASLSFVVLQEHIDRFQIDQEIHKYYPEAHIFALPEVTEGAVITCMKGIEDIEDQNPILFNDCDHLFKCSQFNDFCKNKFDASIDGILLTFLSDEPKFSFVGKDDAGNITKTVEKQVISNEAICGSYYFGNKATFLSAAEEYLKKCNYNEYYMSGVYNVMIDKGLVVRSMQTDFHVPFGVPEEYESAQTDANYEELL